MTPPRPFPAELRNLPGYAVGYAQGLQDGLRNGRLAMEQAGLKPPPPRPEPKEWR